MTMLTSAEAEELSYAVRGVCARMATEADIREFVDTASEFGDDLWQVLCSQIEVAAIAAPENCGGAGLGASTLGIVAHELGRVLAPVPFLSSAVWATGILAASPDPPVDVLTALAVGRSTAAVVAGSSMPLSGRDATVHAQRIGQIWSLSGTADHVLGGTTADHLVVVARLAGESPSSAVFLTNATTAGLKRTAEPVLDSTRPMATIEFDNAEADLLIEPDRADVIVGAASDRAMALLTAEQVGAHERILEIATEYASTRHQFGCPIGSFQAIKHRCADMLVSLEWARSASQAALQAADSDTPGTRAELRWRASMAKAVCSEALRDAAHANLQIHGGIGFTWDHCAHLYLRRARTDEVLFGGPAMHWDRLGTEAQIL